MKFQRLTIIFFVIFVASLSAQQKNLPHFDDYKVPLYKGKIHLPKWIQRISENEWRDQLGKLVESPEVNFAGKYFLAVHSCGTGCRFYTLTNLSSGRELEVLNDFDTAEPTPKTRDGYEYLTVLFSRFDSNLLVAQYEIDLKQGKSKCRERAFLFEKEKLKPITKTRNGCSKL